MRTATAIRLALIGTRTDRLRVVLTACSAALATLGLLAAATVLAIEGGPPPGGAEVTDSIEYTSFTDPKPEVIEDPSAGFAYQYSHNLLIEPGLRPGVAMTLILLCIPLLVLAAQCARLGAPARDRRLASVRLAGASPGHVHRIGMIETGLATGSGVVCGMAAYFGLRVTLHHTNAAGELLLPTDVLPAPLTIAAIALALPLTAMLAAWMLLRRVSVGALGVQRRSRRKPVRPWPGILIALGIGCVAVVHSAGDSISGTALATTLLIGLVLSVIGVALGAGWISYSTGLMMTRLARGPAALLAGKRLVADPWAISRSCSAVLAALLIGAFSAALHAEITAQQRAELTAFEAAGSDWPSESTDFYGDAYQLVDAATVVAVVISVAALLIGVIDGVLCRKRTYAALAATGVPRGSMGRSVLWHAAIPVAVAGMLAVGIGATLGWLFVGDTTATVTIGDSRTDPNGVDRFVEFTGTSAIGFPWLPMLGWWALAVGLVAMLSAVAGRGTLRRGIDVAELRAA